MNSTTAGLRLAFAKSGLTDDELADFLGVAPNTIRNYKLGTSYPTIRGLDRIARKLGVSPAWIVNGGQAVELVP